MSKKRSRLMGPEILEACRLAEVDMQKAVSDPVWQLLFLENPGFVKELPSEFKLLLLKSIYSKWGQLSVPDELLLDDEAEDEDLEGIYQALQFLGHITVDIDPWETEGVIYSAEDTDLERRFEIGNGWSIDVQFADCDLEMKDVEHGCDKLIDLRQWLEAFFEAPGTDIRAFAETCGLSYEPGMSPEEGSYFRFGGIELIHSSGDYFELPASELGGFLESDQKLAELLEAQSGVLRSQELQSLAITDPPLRPIFDGAPSVDEETSQQSDAYEWYSPEGRIFFTWKCDCWLPLAGGSGSSGEKTRKSDLYHFVRQPVDIAFEARGNSAYSYEIVYSHQCVGDAREEILKSLGSDRLNPLYLHALGLAAVKGQE